MSIIKNITKQREFRTFLFLVTLFVLVGLVNSNFLSFENLYNSLQSSLLYIVLSIGMTFVLLTGRIDISVGGILGLSAAVSGIILRDGGSIIVAVIVAILVGGFVGLLNGLGTTKLKIPSFIMTLGMLEITRVVQVIYTDGLWVENLPVSFKQISQIDVFGVNVLSLIVIATVILIHIYLSKTKKGRYFKAVGDNEDGAVLLGIPVKKYVILSFIISGVCSAVAGLIFASQIGFISTNAGSGIEMTVIEIGRAHV